MATVEIYAGDTTFVRCIIDHGTPVEFGSFIASCARHICALLSPLTSPEDRMRAFAGVVEYTDETQCQVDSLEIADEWQYTVRVQQPATGECTVEAKSVLGEQHAFDSLDAFEAWCDSSD